MIFAWSFTAASEAQTLTVLHQFSGGSDGGRQGAGIAMDLAGNIYGATEYGGDWSCNYGDPPGCGVVYRLKKTGSSWVLTPLHTFEYADGDYLPFPGTAAIGPNGSLYDITGSGNYGTVFNSVPGFAAPSSVIARWTYNKIHVFTGSDGSGPNRTAPLVFDSAGNMYGTKLGGGEANSGLVYEMTPSSGGWTESVLYSFAGGSDGAAPRGITFDEAGNIYGVASGGNPDCGFLGYCGLVYELSPSQSGWTKTTLHVFQKDVDGAGPGPLIRDNAGNLFGITEYYGPDTGGTVWELSPSGGGWTFTLLHSFPVATVEDYGPYALTMDAAGNLFGISGTSSSDNDYCGFLFKLTPSNGGWTYTELYDFGTASGQLDGCWPQGAPLLDRNGNVYGATEIGGRADVGTVWEFTP